MRKEMSPAEAMFVDNRAERIVALLTSATMRSFQRDEAEMGAAMADIPAGLPQGFARIVVGFLKAMAAKEDVDKSDEATHKLAKLFLAAAEPGDLDLPVV